MKTTSLLSRRGGRVKRSIALLVVIGLIGTASATFAADATLAEVMELGIYSEETKGDIDAALQLYQQVVAESAADQALAAQAQFRLGICHDKKKDYPAATAAFEKLVRDYPNQKELVALANEYLADGAALLPVPWVDGEELRYDVKLQTGRTVGAASYTASAAELDGRKIWRFNTNILGGNHSWSRTEVDAATFKPIRCLWKHTMMGETDTVYGTGGVDVRMKGKDEVKHFDLQGAVYDNEQTVQLMRRLPLATGYSTTLKLFVGLGGGSQLPLELSVPVRESVTVPAGTFDAYKVVLNIGQTLWFSADEHRYPVKLEAGGAVIELSGVKVRSATASQTYEDPVRGFSVTVPAGWMTYCKDEEPQRSELVFIDADGVAKMKLQVESLENFDAAKRASVRAFAEHRVGGAKRNLKNFAVRADSWTETTVAGEPALIVVADFVQGEKAQTVCGVFAFVNGYTVDASCLTASEDFEAFRPQFDAMVASYRGN